MRDDTGAFRFPPDTETFEVSCIDANNRRLMGVIGLGYPVFSIRARANWIGWTPSARAERLRNVMDAFVLGTVHPYCFLLCGKISPNARRKRCGACHLQEKIRRRAFHHQTKGPRWPSCATHASFRPRTLFCLQQRTVRGKIAVSGRSLRQRVRRFLLLEWFVSHHCGVCRRVLYVDGKAETVGNRIPQSPRSD